MKVATLSMIVMLYGMFAIFPSVRGGKSCTHPKGHDGESRTEECLNQTCKNGVWRPSMDPVVCCYNQKSFPINSTITTTDSDDGCVTTTLKCQDDGGKAMVVLSLENRCSWSTSKQVKELKTLLELHNYQTEQSRCSEDFPLMLSTSTTTNTTTATTTTSTITESIEGITSGLDEFSTVLGSVVEGAAQVGKPVYKWVPLDNKKVPENALLAAKDHDNAVYIGRGMLDGSIRLGKFHAEYEVLFVPHLGKEKEIYENIEVLCVDEDAQVHWVDCEDGNLPAGAIVGTIVDGKSEFVGRGRIENEISPGRIVPEDNCMYASYGGNEEVMTTYQALVIHSATESIEGITSGLGEYIPYKPIYEWAPLDNKKVPVNALRVAEDQASLLKWYKYYDVYIGRGMLDGSIRLGKFDAESGILYVSHLGEEKEIHENIEVLCVERYQGNQVRWNEDNEVQWVDCEDGNVPAGAIVGTIVDGKSEYVGRGRIEKALVGRIVPEDGCMYASSGGKAVVLTTYQALVIQ